MTFIGTTIRTGLMTTLALTLLLSSFALHSEEVHAERKNVLDGTPAVRHRKLLVRNRFEFTPAFESSINADFKHVAGFGAKLEYHLSDLLSVGALGFFGVSYNTGLTDKIVDGLPAEADAADPTPSKAQFSSHLNEMPFHGALYVGATPWHGKLAAFGKFFLNFDFYFQGGLSLATLRSDCASSVCNDNNPTGGIDGMGMAIPRDGNPNNDPVLNSGFRAGLYVGGGIHVFINDFIALDLSVRNYLFSDNPSGLDFDADYAVTEDDNRTLNHLFMGLGVSVLLPMSVSRTD